MQATLFDGVVSGLQLGLLGIGLSLLYGLGGILNLAHGAFAVGAAIATSLAMGAGLPAFPAVLLGIAAAAVVSLVVDRTIMRGAYAAEGEARVLLSLLLTLGTAFVIDGLIEWRYPSAALSLRIGGGAVDVLGVPMRRGSLVAAAVSLVALAGLMWLLRGTRHGRAIRSIIQDEEGARLVGINPARVRTAIFALSGALAGLVAMTQSMTSPVTVTSGFDLTIQALIVTVVGGLGSPTGALLAGILLGIVNAISAATIGAYITSIILLAAAGLTILIRPGGLAGRAA